MLETNQEAFGRTNLHGAIFPMKYFQDQEREELADHPDPRAPEGAAWLRLAAPFLGVNVTRLRPPGVFVALTSAASETLHVAAMVPFRDWAHV